MKHTQPVAPHNLPCRWAPPGVPVLIIYESLSLYVSCFKSLFRFFPSPLQTSCAWITTWSPVTSSWCVLESYMHTHTQSCVHRMLLRCMRSGVAPAAAVMLAGGGGGRAGGPVGGWVGGAGEAREPAGDVQLMGTLQYFAWVVAAHPLPRPVAHPTPTPPWLSPAGQQLHDASLQGGLRR